MPKSDLPFGLVRQSRREVGALLRRPVVEILTGLESADERERGLSVEALAFHVMALLRLKYVATRLRGTSTAGTETDLIFEDKSLVFRQWQVQCRNAPAMTVDDVAREVGLLDYFGSDVGVVVSTGSVDEKARSFAEVVRKAIRQPVVLIDRTILEVIDNDPAALAKAIRVQAPTALATV
jgi:hypothetical protein